MMWTMVILTTVALADTTTCPPIAVQQAETTLEQAVQSRGELRAEVLGTNWQYKQATGDRDQVRVEETEAREALKGARSEVRDARRTLGAVRQEFSKEELTCDPSASVAEPAETVKS